MKSKCFLSCLMVVVLFFGQNTFAQHKENGLPQPKRSSINTVPKADSSDADTDSLTKWKNSREFAYMNFLDSMLRKRNDLKVDTVSIDPATGKIGPQVKKTEDFSAINNFLNSFPLRLFFWILAIIFILFIFNKIFLKSGIFSRRRTAPIENEDGDALHGLDEYAKYDALIAAAEAKNDFNLAIRYLFLKTLKNLADKELINFSPDKTNHNYLAEMTSNAGQKQFSTIINNYEYVWYGKFRIDKNKYEQLKETFITFNKKV